jgi:hypothetical protein
MPYDPIWWYIARPPSVLTQRLVLDAPTISSEPSFPLMGDAADPPTRRESGEQGEDQKMFPHGEYFFPRSNQSFIAVRPRSEWPRGPFLPDQVLGRSERVHQPLRAEADRVAGRQAGLVLGSLDRSPGGDVVELSRVQRDARDARGPGDEADDSWSAIRSRSGGIGSARRRRRSAGRRW